MCPDSVVSTAWDAFKIVFVFVKHQFEYVKCSEEYADGLRREVENLKYEADKVREDAKVAGNNLRNIHEWVKNFLPSAEKTLNKAKDLLGEFENMSKTCCRGTLPDPICRYRFSRKAKHMTNDIKNLIREIGGKEISAGRPAPGDVAARIEDRATSLASTSIKVGDDGVFDSRASVMQKIMDALADDTKSVVGVHGMGGVGKSTLLVDVERRILREKEKLFDRIAKADVSQNPDIKTIQKEIAHCLGLSTIKEEEDVKLRAKSLLERLEDEERNKRKVLIILDDLWEQLDLKLVGIPCGHNNRVKGCKLLMTARDQNVLEREMLCDVAFHLDFLNHEEAKALFEATVRDKVGVELEPLVEKALRICGGLPFLILVIAKLFINTTYSECKNELNEILNGVAGEKIERTLRLSYNRLKTEEQLLLRLCAVFGVPKPSLENLVRYGVGLGLFGQDKSMKDAREMLGRLIRTLQASSLLLHSREDDGFKIHDLVRMFVASIVSRDHPLLVLKDESVAELWKDKVKSCEAICIPYVSLEELPEQLDCPDLKIFMLFNTNNSLEIPDSYFNSMGNLMVLDLTRMRLSRSPLPFQSLKKLHTLCLDDCLLVNMAILGELKELQILSIINSNLHQLPQEIGQLAKLRLLELKYCRRLETIEPGVLASLTKLEELYMENISLKWNAMGQMPPTNATLIELNNMKNLCTLYVSIPDPSVLPQDLNFKRLTKYIIKIGKSWRLSRGKGSNTLGLQLDPKSDVLRKGCIQSILGKIEDLYLQDLNGSEQSICALSHKGFPELKHLEVVNSLSVHYILQSQSHANFEKLESLILDSLVKLEKICYGPISAKSFGALKEVRVHRCHKMEVLFPFLVVRGLPQLEEIAVDDCKSMCGIVEVDDRGKLELPKLRVLKLQNLPNIKSFFIDGTASLSRTSDDQVGTPIAFFNGQQVAFPSLEELSMSGFNNIEMIWDSEVIADFFQTLKSLRVDKCNRLKRIWHNELLRQVRFPCPRSIHISGCKSLASLFPASVARDLIQLEELTINDCGIVELIEKEEGIISGVVLPKLTSLKLKYLTELKCTYAGTHALHWPALKTLKVQGCNKVEILASQPENKMSLHKRPLFLIEKDAFLRLETLEIIGLDDRRFIFFPSMLESLSQVRDLTVSKCNKMEAIIMEEEGLGLETTETPASSMESEVAFHQLKYIKLDGLRELRCFSSGRYNLMFPLLEDVIVGECPNMNFFFEGQIEAPNLKRVQAIPKEFSESTEHQNFWKGNLNIAIQNMFEDMGTFASIEEMRLSEVPELIEKWHGELNPIKSYWQLNSLIVYNCPSFVNAIPPKLMLALDNLGTLQVQKCELLEEIFNLEGLEVMENTRVLPRLRTLTLGDLPKLRQLWNKDLQGMLRFNSLTGLTLYTCRNLRHAFVPSMVQCVASLTWMEIKECGQMEKVIAEEEGQGSAVEKVTFPKLRSIWLERLPNLTSFVSGKNHMLECPELRGLRIAHCSNMRSLTSGPSLFTPEVSFPSLESLTMEGLPNLKEICSNESPLELSNLQSIEVRQCQSLSKVISFRSLMNLQKLRTLTIRSCISMQEIFYRKGLSTSGNYTTLFGPATFSLEKLEVHNCDNLQFMFFPSMVKPLAQLRDLMVSGCKKMEAIVMEEEPLGLETSETLAFPMLTNLCLQQLESLICFSCRKSSKEVQSHNLVQSRSTALFNREIAFPSLEELEISGMDSIERIMGNQVATDCFQNLKSLRVGGCNKLKCVWDKELHHQVKFQCLRFVSISKCGSLTSLFPTSVARDLTQLEELEIDACGIVELIEKEEGLIPRVVLPKLTSLKLKYLTELKCTYIGVHALHFPALKTLEVHGCNKVEILASQPENKKPLHKQPLFLIEKGGLPNLEELKWDLSEQMEICHEHFQNEEFFCKLRVVELRHISNDSAISACHFIERVTNLEELVVCQSYLEVPSNNEEAMEGSRHEQKVILPFSRHIQHLKTLDVSNCYGLSNIFTPTIAEYLRALVKLKISNCRMLTEVISDETGKEGRVVAFNQLKYLELDGLIGLRCFGSGGYTLMFPLLEDVIVSGCPNMKFFAEGPIEASKLARVKASEEVWFWKENLNVTVQNMFDEMGTMVGVMSMQLSKFPQLIGKWHTELNPIESSWQLNSLVVDRCPSFVNAIPSRLMLVLGNLMDLQVHDCESLEEIFDLEGLEAMESTQALPRLQDLMLVNLPKLRRLWNKDLQESLRFNYLSGLFLSKCSNLGHAFTPSMARCIPNLWRIEIKECGEMEGVIADENGPGSVVGEIVFPKLWRIELERLPNLTSFLLGKNHTLKCPKLKVLSIAHCPKMRSLTQRSWMEIDEGTPPLFTPEVQFPLLESMALSHMDNLSKIWTDSPQENLTFDYLEKVEAQNCKSLVNLFPYWVATSLNQVKELRVESCGMEEIVAGGDYIPHTNTSQVLFPKLTSLVLHDMLQLKSFCPNLLTLNWPLMEELRVTHCNKLNRLCLATSMNNWAQRDDHRYLLDREAQSLFERGFPNIKRLLLVEKDIQMIADGKFPNDIFGKPKAITLACFHDENAVFPPKSFLKRFQNLQSLEIFCCSFEDIFLDEELVDEGKHLVLESLRELKLSKLYNLKHLWREDYLVSKILQSIKTLEIWDCPSLTTLFPIVTSFQNLTKLVVKNSSGLVNLVMVSAVMNLGHLIQMTIIGCERMKELVRNDEKGEEKVITFGKLEQLILQQLPSLECFSSTTSCSFRFPSLWCMKVEECPKMKFFSKGRLQTPQLYSASLFGYYWECHRDGDDLNTFIQKFST